MKVKIRGLVFVGFAAAVFAQSAMANATTDAKTVTSKLYVDSKIVATDATNNNATTIASNSPDDKAPSALNVYKFVTGQVEGAAITIQGDNTYIEATAGTGNSAGTWTVSPKETVATTAAQLTGPIANGVAGAFTGTDGNKLVSATAVKALIDGESTNGTTTLGDSSTNATVPTSKNVVDYAEKKANKATAIIPTGQTGANSTSNTAYPTTKAVYDFVTTQGGNYQPKTPTTDGTSLYLGHNTVDGTTNTADWKKLEAVSTDPQATPDYVTITEDNNGVYQVNIPVAQVASAYSDFVASDHPQALIKRPKLTTAGAVYEFVKAEGGNYQPKVADSNAGKIMIGFNTQTGEGSGATYSSDWKELIGASTDASSATGYVTIKEPVSRAGVYEVNIAENMIAVSGNNIAAATATGDGANYFSDLTTAWAVKQYVGSLLNGNVLPAPGSDCQLGENGITDSNDKACALVLAYWSAAESPTGTAGVGLKWVPMAQTVSSGS